MIEDLLNRFEPDEDVLLCSISFHVSYEMLDCISRADYGEDANEHFSALQQIRDTGSMPENPDWIPMEVLELIRWSEPDDPEWKPGRTGEFGHRMRAFHVQPFFELSISRAVTTTMGARIRRRSN